MIPHVTKILRVPNKLLIDRTNRVISLGSDVSWRRHLVESLDLKKGDKVLDLATGTADVAIMLGLSLYIYLCSKRRKERKKKVEEDRREISKNTGFSFSFFSSFRSFRDKYQCYWDRSFVEYVIIFTFVVSNGH